jgi:hypothetical protein
MSTLGWIALSGVLLVGAYLAFRRRPSRVDSEVRRLRRACRGDRELVERLIFAEMQRDSRISMSVAAMRARRRLARDRR